MSCTLFMVLFYTILHFLLSLLFHYSLLHTTIPTYLLFTFPIHFISHLPYIFLHLINKNTQNNITLPPLLLRPTQIPLSLPHIISISIYFITHLIPPHFPINTPSLFHLLHTFTSHKFTTKTLSKFTLKFSPQYFTRVLLLSFYLYNLGKRNSLKFSFMSCNLT